MDTVVLVFAVLAGIGIGVVLVNRFTVRHLMNELLLMKREGFVSYPKIIKPPKSTAIEYRED